MLSAMFSTIYPGCCGGCWSTRGPAPHSTLTPDPVGRMNLERARHLCCLKTEKGRPGGANIPMMLFTPDSEILLARDPREPRPPGVPSADFRRPPFRHGALRESGVVCDGSPLLSSHVQVLSRYLWMDGGECGEIPKPSVNHRLTKTTWGFQGSHIYPGKGG